MTQIDISITPASLGEGKEARIVKFAGQLDETNVDHEAQKIYQIFEEVQGKLVLIFDFADLTYLNSKSIGYLADWCSKATERGGKLYICTPRDNVLDILKVVGLTNIIEVFLTVEEAKLAAMNI